MSRCMHAACPLRASITSPPPLSPLVTLCRPFETLFNSLSSEPTSSPLPTVVQGFPHSSYNCDGCVGEWRVSNPSQTSLLPHRIPWHPCIPPPWASVTCPQPLYPPAMLCMPLFHFHSLFNLRRQACLFLRGGRLPSAPRSSCGCSGVGEWRVSTRYHSSIICPSSSLTASVCTHACMQPTPMGIRHLPCCAGHSPCSTPSHSPDELAVQRWCKAVLISPTIVMDVTVRGGLQIPPSHPSSLTASLRIHASHPHGHQSPVLSPFTHLPCYACHSSTSTPSSICAGKLASSYVEEGYPRSLAPPVGVVVSVSGGCRLATIPLDYVLPPPSPHPSACMHGHQSPAMLCWPLPLFNCLSSAPTYR